MTGAKKPFAPRQMFSLAAVLFFHVAGFAGEATEKTETTAATEAAKPPNEIKAVLTGTNLPAAADGVPVDTNSVTEYVPPTKLDHLNYVLSLARFSASTRDFPAAEKSFE